ncbi:VOC family protein [Shimazuella kribbensis]|uniref:VOC family protein n=1 Tax=Shimazuella kribbensis TaxID=139808 RepID=UPI000402C8BB|nr:VOC family protein [Shimazuella kribbensis]
MNNKQLLTYNQKREIQQIAVVTPDIEKTMKAWVDNLGIGPWIVVTVNGKSLNYMHYQGALAEVPFEFIIAMANVSNNQFELIQPVSGPTIYEEFLRDTGEGLHHIKEKIADKTVLLSTLEKYKTKSLKITQDGSFGEDVHYYLNTEDKLGFSYELGNSPDMELPPDMYTIYPSEKE